MQRRGSVLTTAIVLTGVFLTMIVGTMAIYDSSNRRANSEKWRDTAEQAARSGLDLVMGWGQANIDTISKLPQAWEMNDGDIRDPVTAYMQSIGVGDSAIYDSNPLTVRPGQILGSAGTDQVGEYVLARVGTGAQSFLVTFKARIQQYQVSTEMPRQYRIGVIGRVRKAGNTPANLTSNERGPAGNLVAERMMMAHVGKEPFSRYAALIDVDFVQNWVPGEIVDGPVHINRGYVDDPAADNPVNGVRPTNASLRSLMMLHSTNSPKGFSAVPGRQNFPVFTETVSMTAINDAKLNDFSPNNNSRFIQYDEAPFTGTNAASMFTAPDNVGALTVGASSFNGPTLLGQNVEMPRSSRSRLNFALGLPAGQRVNDVGRFGWFNSIEDGVYIPTRATWTGADPGAPPAIPNSWRYQTASDVDAPAGGIYVRGNVEIMRMGVSGVNSYYVFQLGYANFGLGVLPSRVYIIRANRQTLQMDMYAGPVNTPLASYYSGGNLTAAEMDAYVTGTLGGAALTTNPQDFRVTVNAARRATLRAAGASAGFPFNGVIFVDLSAHDPARHPGDPTLLLGGATPLTGNIYALGDPGSTPSRRNTKRPLAGNREERVATYVGTTPAAAASKLTILTAGNVFIQNDIMLDAVARLAATGNGFNPTQDNFTLESSRDLIGIVSDKQVVVGVAAPSETVRQNAGTVVHAAIAALGDPALDYSTTPRVDAREMVKPLNMRGSFTTEALMTAFPAPKPEQYNMLNVTAPATVFGQFVGEVPNVTNDNDAVMPTKWADLRFPVETAPGSGVGRFPGTPLADALGFSGPSNNPNFTSTRGRLVVFGSVTQKKRGILGVGNRSYDKDIRYDKRLMSIAPPLFPTSTNIIVRTSRPFSPNAQMYRPTAPTGTPAPNDQAFMAYP